MAIKYYTIPEKKQTIAVLPNTKWDVYNKIDKMMDETGFHFHPSLDKRLAKFRADVADFATKFNS